MSCAFNRHLRTNSKTRRAAHEPWTVPSPFGSRIVMFCHPGLCWKRNTPRKLPPRREQFSESKIPPYRGSYFAARIVGLAGKVYPHETGIQETFANHRKFDS